MIASPHWQGKSDYAEKLLVFLYLYSYLFPQAGDVSRDTGLAIAIEQLGDRAITLSQTCRN